MSSRSLSVAAVLVGAALWLEATPPEEVANPTPPHSSQQERLETAYRIVAELIEDARDAANVVTERSTEQIVERLASQLRAIVEDPASANDQELHRSLAEMWRRYVRATNLPQAALSPEEDPPAAMTMPSLAARTAGRGPAGMMSPLVAGDDGFATAAGTAHGESAPPESTGLEGAGTGPRERVVVLAESIQQMPEAERVRLLPLLEAVIQAEVQRHSNWGEWDSYRVQQWKSVFEQSHSFSWWVFLLAHVVLLAALAMSFWEFARAGAISRRKDQEAAARREERQTTLAHLTSFPPEAQAAGVTALLSKAEEQARQETELEISANKLVMRTSIMGFVMMGFALAFYALFILYVYPIQQTGTVGGRLPGASSAPPAVQSAN